MSDEPFARVGGLDVYRPTADVPADSLAVMIFHGQEDGALPNNSRVRKCNSEPDDAFPDGTEGTVLASKRAPGLDEIGYYVAFDPRPLPCFIAGRRIERA